MQVKGFVNIQSLLSNVDGITSEYGELSAFGASFSREKGYYQSDVFPDYNLVTMSVTDDAGNRITLTQADVEHITTVVHRVKQYTSNHLPPFDLDHLRLTVYSQTPTVKSLEIGNLVTTLPHWISWQHKETNARFLFWFHDVAFRNQYDEYEIIVVPPVPDIDSFFTGTNNVQTLLATETVDKTMLRAHTAKGSVPETYLHLLKFHYVDPINRSVKIPTYWPIIIYGEAGNNIDSIKDAIVDYIEEHSTRTRTEWEVIFPEIFTRTEFIILPRWDQIAIPNMLAMTGLYSSVCDPVEFVNYARDNVPFYTQTHITNNTYMVPFPYKTLALTVVNGQNNIDGKKDFKELFPDYLPIGSTSMDFNRMRNSTQQLITELASMLPVAETMDRYTFIPVGMKRITRGGRKFLAKLIDNVNYVIIPKNLL